MQKIKQMLGIMVFCIFEGTQRGRVQESKKSSELIVTVGIGLNPNL